VKIRFQADADIDPDIRKGLLLRDASIDFRVAAGILPDGTADPEVLKNAAADGRVLVSADVHTMIGHFGEFTAFCHSPGVLLIPSNRSIGTVIESLLFVWQNWTPEDLHNQVKWLPSPPAEE